MFRGYLSWSQTPKHNNSWRREHIMGEEGTETPRSLLFAVFYVNSKNFCLHESSEHTNLKILPLKHFKDPNRYIFTENGSKNWKGILGECCIENKTVPIYLTYKEVWERCHVFLLIYISAKCQKKQKRITISICVHLPHGFMYHQLVSTS